MGSADEITARRGGAALWPASYNFDADYRTNASSTELRLTEAGLGKLARLRAHRQPILATINAFFGN